MTTGQPYGLGLNAKESKGLVFSRGVRSDWRLMEVDEKMLEEIMDLG